MQKSIQTMVSSLREILGGDVVCIYMFGSAAMDDFRVGWSDIDFLCLTGHELTDTQALRLLPLRQTLLEVYPFNPYFRSFEGIITSVEEFRANTFSTVVYWGTSGQRIRSSYAFDVFSQYSLMRYGRLLFGTDIRDTFSLPTYPELVNGVREHYLAIRNHAQTTDSSVYSCGWLLDIARCLYTLKTGGIISKTDAGYWALKEELCPEPNQLRKALQIRCEPMRYRDDVEIQHWLSGLGPAVQRFADILQQELEIAAGLRPSQ